MASRVLFHFLILACAIPLTVLGSISVAWAEPSDSIVPVEAFSKKPDFSNMKLSPSGKYLALVVPLENNFALAMLQLPELKQVGHLKLQGGNSIVNFWWKGDNKIVAALGIQDSPIDSPYPTGELVSVNVDGSDFKYLFGERNVSGVGITRRQRKQLDYAGAVLFDPLIDDPDHIIVITRRWIGFDENPDLVFRYDLKSNDLEKIATSPEAGSATQFLMDSDHNVRYAVTSRNDFESKTWQRLPQQPTWQIVPKIGDKAPFPLSFSADNKSVYLRSQEFGPRDCLVEHVLDTGERRKLACDDRADLDRVIFSLEPWGTPIAAVFSAGEPELKLLDAPHPHQELLKQLIEAFPHKQIVPTSITRDGAHALIFVYDDRTPGDYYLFDVKARKADYLAGVRNWLDPNLMSERRPITLKARDGTSLWGYLTLPHGISPEKLPLIVNPHGGPYHIRDEWRFDTEAQLLASRGYAVLQINFRGSGGYGSQFLAAGKKAWATTMIDDITDAAKWTIEQGYADPHRVCIYGASYGGYAAMMSAVREPELYRCVIASAGVYDLKRFKKDSDIGQTKGGRDYLVEAIGGTESEQIAQSPITYLDKLKAPVLIVHGEDDQRTPFSQAKLLREAMDQRKLPYEWLTKKGEGHGFWRTANVTEFYRTMLAFLDKNLGHDAPAASEIEATAP